MLVHTPSLLLVNLLITATLAICLGAVSDRARRDGLVFWAAALAAHTLAYLLLSLRGLISDAASVVLANGLLSVELSLYAVGVYQFQQRQARRWLVWAPVPLVLVAFTLLLQFTQARIVLSALVLSYQCVLLVWLIMSRRHETTGRGQYFAITGLSVGIVALLFRAASALSGGTQIVSITDSNQVQATTFLFSTVATVLACLGLVLMAKESADERNRTLAMQDELTGLKNRRYIQDTLEQHLALSTRNGRPLALLMIDIDFFKRINDTYGHLSGDKVLRDLSACIQERVRAQDLVGRWGGEEFFVILPDTDVQGAKFLAEQLRRLVERTRFESVDGRKISLTISLGLNALQTVAGQTVDDVVGVADQAMYRAKQNGRNRVEQL
jgi:diguanylate cyclase (GGDEF)-like protein